jgi:hypothetical protein
VVCRQRRQERTRRLQIASLQLNLGMNHLGVMARGGIRSRGAIEKGHFLVVAAQQVVDD